MPARYSQAKALDSAIYFLLHGADFSALHRLQSDEIYHFYRGDPVELLLLFPDGSGEVRFLGPALEAGQQPQAIVRRGVWQGSRLKPDGHYALMGTTLAPAYDPSDFELGEREMLIQQYPTQAELIRALTRT